MRRPTAPMTEVKETIVKEEADEDASPAGIKQAVGSPVKKSPMSALVLVTKIEEQIDDFS